MTVLKGLGISIKKEIKGKGIELWIKMKRIILC